MLGNTEGSSQSQHYPGMEAPALPEPTSEMRRGANALGAMLIAYTNAGFTRAEAYGLVQMILHNQGHH
ncbi:hypothetical protein [Saccharothrix hoggarensis]|uniref:Uncharacterized protein n=1 Tax=Saccharothrix hoggarensis TaxID=913853 RepID=A0ABW3QN42_9PSEU